MTTSTGNKYLTLLDWAKREAPGGGIDEVIEVLAASNPIVADANVLEGNLPTGHRTTQRTSEPSGTWRELNSGVDPERSTTKQITDTVGMLEAYSRVDVDLASLGGTDAAFRASEDDAFISGLNSTVATAVLYGNQKVNPEQLHGLSARYADLKTTNEKAGQIINAGGSGNDNTSIWFITWGPQTVSLIFPKGSQAGLTVEDLGKQLVADSNGKMFQAWVTRFQWKLGLMLKDYRFVTRIANIDVSDLTTDATSGADLLDKMVDAFYSRPTMDLGDMGRTIIYTSKTVAKFLHKQAMSKSNVNLSLDDPAGKPIVNFLGAPVKVLDNLTIAEAALTT